MMYLEPVLLKKSKKAGFYSILADEVSSHNIVHLPICFWFVDDKCKIRADLETVRAADIVNAITKTLSDVEPSLNEL